MFVSVCEEDNVEIPQSLISGAVGKCLITKEHGSVLNKPWSCATESMFCVLWHNEDNTSTLTDQLYVVIGKLALSTKSACLLLYCYMLTNALYALCTVPT